MKNRMKDNILVSLVMISAFILILVPLVMDGENIEPFDSHLSTSTHSSYKRVTTAPKYEYDPILDLANSYVRTMPFSYSGLVSQLEYEGYERDDIYKSMRKLKVDWDEMCLRHARDYRDLGISNIRSQLRYEGYLADQIDYAMDRLYK